VVYELIDPRDGACKYVGQTFDVDSRRRAHLAPTPIYQQNAELHKWKIELASLGLSPEFRIIDRDIPPARINEQESFWCRVRADEGCQLLNKPVGHIRKGDLLGSPKRYAIARSGREVREMLMAIGRQLSGKLPEGRPPFKHLKRCIHELTDFIHAIDD
jgi:hypothetical protein